jgi:hypothetical protein
MLGGETGFAKPRLRRSFDSELIGLLDAICAELEISEAMFALAKERYDSIATYLNEPGSPLRPFNPKIHPQGSINIGTTVKPLFSNEFDVDVICLMALGTRLSKESFKKLVYDRLAQRGCYTLREMNRCIRVQYANEFHIDITPAIPDDIQGPQNILITDKEQGRWKESNPRDYAEWFRESAKFQPRISYNESIALSASDRALVEPLPAPKSSRPILNRIVQLLKRHRDEMYKGHKDAPISAIITTLCAHSYRRNTSIVFDSEAEFLSRVVADMPKSITRDGVIETVPNPQNPLENFADKWLRKPQRRAEFYKWHAAVVAHFDSIIYKEGRSKTDLVNELSAAYGKDITNRAVVANAEQRRAAAESQTIGVTKGSGLIAPSAGIYVTTKQVVPVRKHTNFGRTE